MRTGQIRIGLSNYPSVNKKTMSRNSYTYLYLRVEIRTYIHTRRVSSGYRVPITITKGTVNNSTIMSTKISILTKMISVLSRYT
jgi:hypothetical protein